MKNTQKGFVGPLLLVIIALLLIGGGVYIYMQKDQTNQPVTQNQTAQATQTADPATDTIIKVDVASANTIAELHYNGNTYTEDVCNDNKMLSLIKELNGISNSVVCKSSATAWALSAQMKSNPSQYSCSDYTTQGVIRNSAITTTSCE